VAGNARRELEKKSGRKVVTSDNFLTMIEPAKTAKPLTTAKAERKRSRKR
jgi:hypothetical protein